MVYNGKIHLIIGPMFSGKTSMLINLYRRYTIGNKKCILVKYALDNRYDEIKLSTHDKLKMDALSCMQLSEIDNIVQEYDVICIDEIQFYDDAVFYCEKWANADKIIISAGLSGNYNRQPFENISKLIPLAENITFMTSICKSNGNDAAFTMLLSKDESSNNKIIIGTDQYIAADRFTYFNKIL